MAMLRGALGFLSLPELQYNLQSRLIGPFQSATHRVRGYAPYRIGSDRGVEALDRLGISTDPHALRDHAHPVNATIERYLLKHVVPDLIKLSPQVDVVGLKHWKAEILATDSNCTLRLQNPVLDPKDVIRYLNGGGARLAPMQSEVAFVHDSAHHYTPGDIANLFDRSPTLKDLFVTCVFPPELLAGLKPMHPEVYTFERLPGGRFAYRPDGHVAGQYVQSEHGSWWLTTKTLRTDHGDLTIRLLDSYYAHHVIMVTRRAVLPPEFNSFDLGDRVQLPKELVPYFDAKFTHIDRKIYEVAMSYVASVNSVKVHQIKARVRMVANALKRPHMLADEFIAAQLASALATHAWRHMPERLDVYAGYHLITRMGPIRWMRLLIMAPDQAAWEAALSRLDLEPYTATQELRTIIVGNDAPTSTAFNLTLPPLTWPDQLSMLQHILSGATGETSGMTTKHGGSTGQPYFSVYYGNAIARCLLFQAVLKIEWHDLIFGPSSRVLTTMVHHLDTVPLWGPLVAIGAVTVFTLSRRAYSATQRAIGDILHALNIPNMLPPAARAAYYSVKVSVADSHADLRPSALEIVEPAEDPDMEEPEVIFGQPAPPTSLIPVEKALPVPKFPEIRKKTDGEQAHADCDIDGCEFHNAEGPNQCAAGVGGYMGVQGANCHLCQANHLDDELPSQENGVPASRVPFSHPGAKSDETCLTKVQLPKAVVTTCPGCLDVSGNAYARNGPNMCLFEAVGDAMGLPRDATWRMYAANNPRATDMMQKQAGSNERDAHILATRLGVQLTIEEDGEEDIVVGMLGGDEYTIKYRPGHYYVENKAPKHNAGAKNGGSAPKQVVKAALSWKEYQPGTRRAAVLLDAFKARDLGLLLPREDALLASFNAMLDSPIAGRRVKIAYVGGLPGAGKTQPILEAITPLANIPRETFRVITADSDLRRDIKARIKLGKGRGYRVQTYETPFFGSYTPLAIVDDVGKFPPGYIDLLIHCCPGLTHIVLTGDPAQEVFHCPNQSSALNRALPDIDHFRSYMGQYIQVTSRLSKPVAAAMGLVTTSDRETGRIVFDALPNQRLPVITSTDPSQRTLTALGRRAYTMSGCQGITIDHDLEIIVDKSSLLAGDRSVYTALTRSKRAVHIVLAGVTTKSHAASPILRALIAGDVTALRKAVASHIKAHTPPALFDPNKFGAVAETTLLEVPEYVPKHSAGRDSDTSVSHLRAEEAIKTLPHLWDVLDTTPEPHSPPSKYPIEELVTPTVKNPTQASFYDRHAHSISEALRMVGTLIQEVLPKSEREIMYKGNLTDQVDDQDELRALFLRHKRGDKATEDWTIDGRFVYPDHRNYATQGPLGAALFEAYMRTYRPEFPAFDPALWEECGKLDQDVFLDKGLKRLAAIADRHCPEWLFNEAELFMKGQSVTKPGTVGREAKKGQLIVSFCTELNFRFGRIAKYMAKVIARATPKHVYTLDGHTDRDTSEFVREEWDFEKDSDEDDYISFDGTQGAEFPVFDSKLMRAAHLPEEEIEFYLAFLPCIMTFLGLMGFMMASGFKFTLLFNTERSKAYQALKYDIPYGTPIMATGDDVAVNATLKEADRWKILGPHFRLESKRSSSRYPTFCGWVLCPVGVFKKPELLFHRTLFQMSRDNLPACLLNYVADVTPLNQNLEEMSHYITIDELDSHYATMEVLRAEAKRCGMTTFGEFTTTYGARRAYDIRQHGGASNTPSHTTDRNHQTMPYESRNWQKAKGITLPNFVPVALMQALRVALMRVDFSVIESRREGQAAMNSWFNASESVWVNQTTRIPFSMEDTWNDTGCEKTLRLFNSLHSVLEARQDNCAKDVDQGKQSGRTTDKSDQVLLTNEQGKQDTVKRFEEVRREFIEWIQSGGLYDGRELEVRYALRWEAPPTQD